MSKQFQVTITNPERAAVFQRVFGSATVCVKSPVPFSAELLGQGEQLIYDLDLREITDEQRERLIDYMASEFALDRAFVEDKLEDSGMPILARDAIMTSTVNLGLWVDDAPEDWDDYEGYEAEVDDDDEDEDEP